MTINCDCTDATGYRTLAQLRTNLMDRLGFVDPMANLATRTLLQLRGDLHTRLGYAAISAVYAPGMAALLDSLVNEAQQTLFRRLELDKGAIALPARMTADADVTTLDYMAVFNLALALAKAHYGKPDAKVYFEVTEQYIADTAKRRPPNATAFLTGCLQDAQRQILRRYPAVRMDRWFSWSLTAGERFYDFPDNSEAAALLTTPLPVQFSVFAPSGTLVPGPYSYRVSALNAYGETLASTAVTINLTLPATGVLVQWAAVTGATGYRLYGRTAGSELLLATLGAVTEYSDTGAVTPAGTLPTSNTTAECNKTIDPLSIKWVGASRDSEWYPLRAGVPPGVLGTSTTGWPAYYAVKQCLEIWPAPAATEGELRIRAGFAATAFTADSDLPSIDDELVFLLALANAKAHYKQPDASNVIQQFEVHLQGVVAGSHGAKRYIPGQRRDDDLIYTQPTPSVPFA